MSPLALVDDPEPSRIGRVDARDHADAAQEDARRANARAAVLSRRQRRQLWLLLGVRRSTRRIEHAIKEVADEQGDMATTLVNLDIAVGRPPNPEALARASSVDLSPAALAAAELGTGLYRRDAEREVREKQRERAIAKAAASGASVRTLGTSLALGGVGWWAQDPVGFVSFWSQVFGGG